MKFLENLFGKRYLEWYEYRNMIEDMNSREFKRKVKEDNEKVRKEIFKNMKFSG